MESSIVTNITNNVEFISFAGVVIPVVIQLIKDKSKLDPRAINAIVSGVFALLLVLMQIGITEMTVSDFIAQIWTYGLATWTLGTFLYKLSYHKSDK